MSQPLFVAPAADSRLVPGSVYRGYLLHEPCLKVPCLNPLFRAFERLVACPHKPALLDGRARREVA